MSKIGKTEIKRRDGIDKKVGGGSGLTRISQKISHTYYEVRM